MRTALAVSFVAALNVLPAFGSCGSSSCPIELQGLLTPADIGRSSLDYSFQYIDQDQPRIGSRKARAGEIASDHDEIRTINRIASLQWSYAPSANFRWIVTVPFVSRSHEHLEEQSQEIERWNFHALGDVALQARMRVVSREHSAVWLIGGAKLPTGARHERDTAAAEEAEVTIQPGSGSWDGIVGVSYESGIIRDTSLRGPLGHATLIPFFVSATYRGNGSGTRQYRRGNEMQLNAGTQYPLSERIDALLQLNGRSLERDAPGETGEDPSLTGGRFLYLSPGLSLRMSARSSAYVYVQIPVAQHVDGIQLTSSANYVAGFRQRF